MDITKYFNELSDIPDEVLTHQILQRIVIDSEPLANLSPKKAIDLLNVFRINKRLPLHEICVTFKPRYHSLNPTVLHNKFKSYFVKKMNELIIFQPSYIMIPEFNKSGILHYHGIIYFDNANDYWCAEIKRIINRTFGNTKGKQVHDIDNYVKYILKDIDKQKFTIKHFGFLSFPQDKTTEEKIERLIKPELITESEEDTPEEDTDSTKSPE